MLLFSVIVAVRLDVLFSYQSNDLYTAVQTAFQGIAVGDERSKPRGPWLLGVDRDLQSAAALFIGRIVLDIYLTQRFIIAWRMLLPPT